MVNYGKFCCPDVISSSRSRISGKCFDNVSNAWVQYLFYRGFYALFFGMCVVKFAVGVNGVCVEMVPVLVYIN
jgi:hypothetical protein